MIYRIGIRVYLNHAVGIFHTSGFQALESVVGIRYSLVGTVGHFRT